MKTTIVTMFMAALLTFTSCEKTIVPPVTPPAPTKNEMLSKTWRVHEVYYDGWLDPDTTWQDHTATFQSDGTYTIFDGTTTESGTWKFEADETKINFDEGEDIMDIVELSAASLKLKIFDGQRLVQENFIPE